MVFQCSFNLHFAYYEDEYFSYIKVHLSLFFIKCLFLSFIHFFPIKYLKIFSL